MTVTFSLVTSCFNSANTLLDAYRSLLKQSCNDFEWILVDDFSSDDGETRALISHLSLRAPFLVKKIFLEKNYLGSRSVVSACHIASGRYIGILDHDDQLTRDALLIAKSYIKIYDDVPSFAGVCGRCIDENGKLIGRLFPTNSFLANEESVRFGLKITAELFQFTRVEAVKQAFEPMLPGFTNGFAWMRISSEHKYLYVNDVFRVYYVGNPNSYSNSKDLVITYPGNRALAFKQTLLFYKKHLHKNPSYGLRILASYIRHSINADHNFFKIVSGLGWYLTAIGILVYPIAYMKARKLF